MGSISDHPRRTIWSDQSNEPFSIPYALKSEFDKSALGYKPVSLQQTWIRTKALSLGTKVHSVYSASSNPKRLYLFSPPYSRWHSIATITCFVLRKRSCGLENVASLPLFTFAIPVPAPVLGNSLFAPCPRSHAFQKSRESCQECEGIWDSYVDTVSVL